MKAKQISYLLPLISHDFHIARQFILDLFESQFLVDMLTKYGGNLPAAARAAGLSMDEMTQLIRKHNIDPKDFTM